MGKVIVDMSMSLDGFVAGPEDTPKEPLGKNGLVLHDWLSDPDAFARGYNNPAEAPAAIIMGRRTYENSQPYWDGKGPMGDTPCFVLTEKAPAQAGSMFTFITKGGIEKALELARQAAGSKNIGLMGANTDQQFLKAGLVDEIRIHLIPVLLGSGIALFGSLGRMVKLEKAGAVDGPEGTHLTYEVAK
jgi:dihydrofolate reductase